MSRGLMLVIGIIYLGAALSFSLERKWLWAIVALCWGVGNIALAYLSSVDKP